MLPLGRQRNVAVNITSGNYCALVIVLSVTAFPPGKGISFARGDLVRDGIGLSFQYRPITRHFLYIVSTGPISNRIFLPICAIKANIILNLNLTEISYFAFLGAIRTGVPPVKIVHFPIFTFAIRHHSCGGDLVNGASFIYAIVIVLSHKRKIRTTGLTHKEPNIIHVRRHKDCMTVNMPPAFACVICLLTYIVAI